jgi:hypothetical protein
VVEDRGHFLFDHYFSTTAFFLAAFDHFFPRLQVVVEKEVVREVPVERQVGCCGRGGTDDSIPTLSTPLNHHDGDYDGNDVFRVESVYIRVHDPPPPRHRRRRHLGDAIESCAIHIMIETPPPNLVVRYICECRRSNRRREGEGGG